MNSCNKRNKKAILVVSFGTSYINSLKSCIESIEKLVENTFKDYEVRRAFTSGMIIAKMKKRDNIHIDSPAEALDKLQKDGFTEVIVQPLHIMFGEEYEKVENLVIELKRRNVFDKIELGDPLLFRSKDYDIAVDALKTQLPSLKDNEAVILMAHGTVHQANASYFQFEYVAKRKINKKIYIATVEGYPLIEDVIEDLKYDKIEKVNLVPFMLVAGDHAHNDMAGDQEDSWKNILISNGFEVEVYLKGIGENKNIQQIYIDHIKKYI